MSYALRDERRYRYGDYRRWPDDARYELIDGVAYLMAPAPTTDHQTLLLELALQVRSALEGAPCRVLIAPVDVLLPRGTESDDEVDTVLQPDMLVVCDPAKVTLRGVRCAPDWAVEVLSPSSASHDQTIKLAAYERAGVREYWLIHPTDRVLTVYRLGAAGYGKPVIQELSGESAVGVLSGMTVHWEPIVSRLLPAGR
ncbi:MAG: Uma2 family endonuclease [Betaproteobacteria bacterium]|nr:Uma2 family endonuclease [Betaproteobacteria bacterium]